MRLNFLFSYSLYRTIVNIILQLLQITCSVLWGPETTHTPTDWGSELKRVRVRQQLEVYYKSKFKDFPSWLAAT